MIRLDINGARLLFEENKLIPLFNEYKTCTDKLKAMTEDGFLVEISVDKLKQGKKPHIVSKFNPYTLHNINIFIEREANGFKLISTEYKNNRELLNWECSKGHTFTMCWGDFQSGRRCSKCSGRYRKTDEEFKNDIYNLVGNEYSFLEEFNGVDEKIKVRHNVCDYEYKISPYKFIDRGQRCSKCFPKYYKRSNNDFVNEVYSLVGNEYTFLEDYKIAIERLLVRHNSCGHIYHVSPHAFINHNSRCPRCNQSKGEKEVEAVLNKLQLNYTPQYTFHDCRNINPLPFDFAIFDNGNKLISLIEYDGEQHFKPVDFAGKGEEWAEDQFIKIQKHDEIKDQYCNNNNVQLLRIPYWEFDNIESILNTYFEQVFLFY